MGPGHPDYANTMYLLARVLSQQRKRKDAEALFRESIRILEEAGLGESPACLQRMMFHSTELMNLKQLDEAENLRRKILHIMELSKGQDIMKRRSLPASQVAQTAPPPPGLAPTAWTRRHRRRRAWIRPATVPSSTSSRSSLSLSRRYQTMASASGTAGSQSSVGESEGRPGPGAAIGSQMALQIGCNLQ